MTKRQWRVLGVACRALLFPIVLLCNLVACVAMAVVISAAYVAGCEDEPLLRRNKK